MWLANSLSCSHQRYGEGKAKDQHGNKNNAKIHCCLADAEIPTGSSMSSANYRTSNLIAESARQPRRFSNAKSRANARDAA
jgi:hypothetical protein